MSDAPKPDAPNSARLRPLSKNLTLLDRQHLPDVLLRRLTDLLPLILVLLLALITTWLANSMPQEKSEKPLPPATEPDYYMRNFQLHRYTPAGTLSTSLAGVYGDHIPDKDQLRIQQPNNYFVDVQGNKINTTAKRSLSDRQGHNIELFEQVHVVYRQAPSTKNPTPQPIVFESEYLNSTNQQQHIRTNRPVKITQGDNVITGSGMDFSNDNKVVQVHGRVQATIAPTPSKP